MHFRRPQRQNEEFLAGKIIKSTEKSLVNLVLRHERWIEIFPVWNLEISLFFVRYLDHLAVRFEQSKETIGVFVGQLRIDVNVHVGLSIETAVKIKRRPRTRLIDVEIPPVSSRVHAYIGLCDCAIDDSHLQINVTSLWHYYAIVTRRNDSSIIPSTIFLQFFFKPKSPSWN